MRTQRAAELALWVFIGAALSFSYAEVLVELVRDWLRDPNYRHGFLIPLISAGLLWRNRAALKTAPRPAPVFGVLGMTTALAAFILGVAGAEVFTQRMSLLLIIVSVVIFLYGWRHVRAVAFPIGLLVLAIPLPYVMYYGLTLPMQTLAAKISIVGLRVVGVPAILQGNIIHLPGGSLEVAEACSGIRSLYAFLAAGALMVHAIAIPWWARILLFALAIPLSIAGNAIRVWGTGLSAWLSGPGATHGAVHEFFGVFVFAVTLGVFYLLRKGANRLWSSGRSWSSSS